MLNRAIVGPGKINTGTIRPGNPGDSLQEACENLKNLPGEQHQKREQAAAQKKRHVDTHFHRRQL